MDQDEYFERVKKYKKRSLAKETWRRFKKNRTAMLGLFDQS